MRVALATWDYPPAPSGLSSAAREVAESLRQAGADVSVFTLDRAGRSRADGVAMIGLALEQRSLLARLRLWGAIGHLAAPMAFRTGILREHARARFDILEATNWYAPAALVAGRAGLPLVTRCSTPAAFTRGAPATLRDRLDGRAADGLERRQARRSAGLIANTAEHGARIAEAYGLDGRQPQAVIGLSLPPDTLARARAIAYPEDAAPVRLLFVGRSEARKGFDVLLSAAGILAVEAARGTLPDFAIDLVGVTTADLPAALTEAARTRLIARGRLDPAALHAAYAAAHAVLAPSRYESFGLVYQEALAYGRPVLACREDASARTFVGGPGAGLLAREASGPALAEIIRPILRDAALRADLSARARAAAGRFDRETLGRETLALYARAIRAAERGGDRPDQSR